MSKSAEFNSWCITVGVDFRQFMFIKDPTLPKVNNPYYDPIKADAPNNRKTVYQPKDLTGYGAKMTIANQAGVALITLTESSGITIMGSAGRIELFIDNTVTKVSPFMEEAGSDAKYDLFLFPPSGGDIIPIIRGKIPILGTITDV